MTGVQTCALPIYRTISLAWPVIFSVRFGLVSGPMDRTLKHYSWAHRGETSFIWYCHAFVGFSVVDSNSNLWMVATFDVLRFLPGWLLTNISILGRLFPWGLVSPPLEAVKKKVELIWVIFFLKPPCVCIRKQVVEHKVKRGLRDVLNRIKRSWKMEKEGKQRTWTWGGAPWGHKLKNLST